MSRTRFSRDKLKNHLLTAAVRRGAAAHAGVAALRNNAHALRRAKFHQCRHLLRVGRPANRQGHAREHAASIGGVASNVAGENMGIAEQCAGWIQKISWH